MIFANVGKGAARDVSFKLDADEADLKQHGVRVHNNVQRTPVSLLPQGEKVVVFFGVGHSLYAGERLKPFTVKLSYKDMRGRRRSSEHRLDVSQFDGLSTIGKPAEHEIAEALKKIESHVSGFASGFKRMKVETITTDQVRQEEKETIRRIERQHAELKKKREETNNE